MLNSTLSQTSQIPYLIRICGASGSGKSLFTNNLVNHFLQSHAQDILVLQEDRYYRAQDDKAMADRIVTNYDHPDAFEHTLLCQHLKTLQSGGSIEYPEYCYKTHTRLPNTTTLYSKKVIIVEGIMVMSAPDLEKTFDLSLFVDTPPDICLLRRMQRDINERGRTLDCISEQYQNTVKPMYHAFIEPNKHHADIIITGGGENQTALQVVAHHVQSFL